MSGLGTTTTPLAGRDAEAPREYPCDQCGAKLAFSPGQRKLTCGHCGHERAVLIPDGDVAEQDFVAMLHKIESEGSIEPAAGLDSEVTCTTCGATVQFAGTLTATHCSYCGGPISRDAVHRAENRIPAHGMLPFEVDKPRAQNELKKWVSSRWFAPGTFKKRGVQGQFSGVYLPYWTYDALTHNEYEGERGDHYYVTVEDGDGEERQERRTDWTYVSGSFNTFFDDVLISAVQRLPKKLLESLEPWPFDKLIPFAPDVMAGFLAQTYDVSLGDGFASAKEKMERAVERETRQRIGGDEQRVHALDTAFSAITFKHLLLPVWLLAYRYGDKTYQVSINACTGQVRGERPWSIWKIAGFALFVAALIGTIVFLVQKYR